MSVFYAVIVGTQVFLTRDLSEACVWPGQKFQISVSDSCQALKSRNFFQIEGILRSQEINESTPHSSLMMKPIKCKLKPQLPAWVIEDGL